MLTREKELLYLLCCLVAAAVVGSLVFSLAFVATVGSTTSNPFSGFVLSPTLFSVGVYIWIVVAIVAIPTTLLGGVPGYFVLRRLGLFNWWSVSSVGVVFGYLVYLAGFSTLSALTCIATGALLAFIAWLLLALTIHSSGRAARAAKFKR